MSSGIKIEGFDFDDIEAYILEQEIDEYKQKKALKNAVKIGKKALEENLPQGTTGKVKKSIKQKSRNNDYGAEEVLYIDDWKWIFQEFRNTRQTGKYVGLAERTIEGCNNQITDEIMRELKK